MTDTNQTSDIPNPTAKEKDQMEKFMSEIGVTHIDINDLINSDSFWIGVKIAERAFNKHFMLKEKL